MNYAPPPSESYEPPHDLPRPAGRGRIYGLASRSLTVTRQPWFLLYTRDALLFLAITLAALALDNPQAVWRLWWPLPLSLGAALLTVQLHGASPVRFRHLLILAAFAIPLAVRSRFSIASSVPAAGLRETQELAAILFLGVALWVAGSCHPVRALLVWLAALLLSGLVNWPVAERLVEYSPFRAFTLLSLGWGVCCGALLLIGPALMGEEEAAANVLRRFDMKRTFVDLACLVSLAAGLLMGALMVSRQFDAPMRAAMAINAGFTAQRELWLQSVLFGWGGGLLDRMIQVVAEPALSATPPWGGLSGVLARCGIVGVGLLFAWTVMLNRLVRRPVGGKHVRALSLAAALAAFFLIGMMISGAPHSRLAAMVLTGWLGLALIRPITRRTRQPHVVAPRVVPGVMAMMLAVFVAVALALPTWGQSMTGAARAQGGKRGVIWTQRKLYQARGLNPFDPAIPMGLAETYRKLGEAEGRDELIYVRVLNLYHEAQRLDPYDALIPLRLANFQLNYDRQEEAVTTVKDALRRQPKSQDLLGWLFLVAIRLNNNAEADKTLTQAMAYHPMSVTWWRHQYALARRLGQGPLASQALAVALTGAPEDPMLAQADWEAAQKELQGAQPLLP